jgi:hypothetical protein
MCFFWWITRILILVIHDLSTVIANEDYVTIVVPAPAATITFTKGA